MSIDTFRLPPSAPPVTWMDVARRLARLEPVDHLWQTRPLSLVEVLIDWSCATFFLENVVRDQEPLLEWLGQVFHGRVPAATEPFIILDGPAPSDRLPIEIIEVYGSRTNLSILGSIEGRVSFVPAKTDKAQNRPVQVIACHSVKGGTGRTTVAVALANAWSDQLGRPVLLVDADLEAPGLSYIFRSTRPEIDVSLEDIVTMAHAEPNGGKRATIAWASRRLKGQQLGNLLILPLRRDLDELASSGIRAEHVASPDRPYAFADLLADLAAECGCAGVVVDVRAGLVPLAAQLVLDPQVARVVVTSIAGQSLEATVSLMDFISRELRKAGHKGLQPLLVVNRIPGILRDIDQEDSIIGPFVARVEQAIAAPIEQDIPSDKVLFDSEEELSPLALIKLGEVADLQVPSKRWQGFSEQLENSGFSRRLNIGLLPWLAQFTVQVNDENDHLAPPVLEAEDALGASERRRQLADFTSRFIAAETSDEPVVSPLITGPMRALVSETAQLPIVVCEGAKGTGKTLTARYLLSKETWAKAAESIGGHIPEADGAFLPVLGSVQASAKFQVEIDHARSTIGAAYGFGSPQSVQALRMMLRERASSRMSEREWSDMWLDAIAWSAGFFPEESGAGELFLSELSQSGRKFVALIEGVEELYDNPSNPSLAPMLRALLLDLPLRLRGAPGRPLGLILFARRDTVEAGVAQNRNQFRQQYQDYALTWNESSVLELAAWLATESKALTLWDENFYRLSTAERERCLSSLWGTKLGPDDQPGRARVQEAYTANWVVAALSDLQERLVARDLVRFLHNAAAETNQSESRERYGSRLLFPKALRDAMGPTSRAKVEETEEEIPELKPAFQKFRDNSNVVKAPLDPDSIAALQLTGDDIEALKTHGIVLGDSPPYEVPELFRMGLGLRHAGARYSVIGTRRRARQRLAQGI